MAVKSHKLFGPTIFGFFFGFGTILFLQLITYLISGLVLIPGEISQTCFLVGHLFAGTMWLVIIFLVFTIPYILLWYIVRTFFKINPESNGVRKWMKIGVTSATMFSILIIIVLFLSFAGANRISLEVRSLQDLQFLRINMELYYDQNGQYPDKLEQLLSSLKLTSDSIRPPENKCVEIEEYYYEARDNNQSYCLGTDFRNEYHYYTQKSDQQCAQTSQCDECDYYVSPISDS